MRELNLGRPVTEDDLRWVFSALYEIDRASREQVFTRDFQTKLDGITAGANVVAAANGSITVTGTTSNFTAFSATSTVAGTEGPSFECYHNSPSPAVFDIMNGMYLRANNDNAEKVTYAQVEAQIIDVSDGAEEGRINMRVANGDDGVLHTPMRAVLNGIVVRGYSGAPAVVQFEDGGPGIYSGSGTPEGSVAADVGSLFLRTDGGASTTLYVKESGTGDTGWVAK